MFTGIIEDLGTVKGLARRGELAVIRVETALALAGEKPGASIAVNGACLTMIGVQPGSFEAEVSPESLALTNLGQLKVNDKVNLERPLTPTSRLGGHLVAGHVEDMVVLTNKREKANYLELTFSCRPPVARYIVKKGSVAIDGISLTVNECDENSFSVVIIPHTVKATTLGLKGPGAKLNVETDIIGKYVEKLMQEPKLKSGVSLALLKDKGFL